MERTWTISGEPQDYWKVIFDKYEPMLQHLEKEFGFTVEFIQFKIKFNEIRLYYNPYNNDLLNKVISDMIREMEEHCDICGIDVNKYQIRCEKCTQKERELYEKRT